FALVYLFFFFQAEDGIRDGHVTGVQTCALPISPRHGQSCSRRPAYRAIKAEPLPGRSLPRTLSTLRCNPALAGSGNHHFSESERSEERRVGKEWRVWGAPVP